MSALNTGEQHMLKLVRKGADSEGWAKVSKQLLPYVQNLPSELVTVEETETGGRAKLTEAGNTVLNWL